MQTYESMNQKIVGLLRISDDPSVLYAAQRIEELEHALAERDAEIERMGQTFRHLDRARRLLEQGVDLARQGGQYEMAAWAQQAEQLAAAIAQDMALPEQTGEAT